MFLTLLQLVEFGVLSILDCTSDVLHFLVVKVPATGGRISVPDEVVDCTCGHH